MRVPKLWDETIEAHRLHVRAAILDATWALATERGPASVKMSEVAEKSGIGRATLYKYFPDVETILAAWHHRQITRHLDHLAEVQAKVTDPGERLRTTLEAYAHIHQRRAQHQSAGSHGTELVTLLHQNGQVVEALRQLHDLICAVLKEAAQAGEIRDDIAAEELTTYCMHALTAAGALPSKAAMQRLVAVTIAGLRPTG